MCLTRICWWTLVVVPPALNGCAKRDTAAPDGVAPPLVGATPGIRPIRRSQRSLMRAARCENRRVQMDHDDPRRPSRRRAHGRLFQIRKHERSLLVELLGLLAELDRRRTVLALGFSSLFSFCTDRLGLTKASAFRRTTAARLLARFPVIAEYLADGRLNLTTLVELRDVLDEAHATEILDRAAGRTEDQVKQLVAALRPQPAPPDLLRKLPTQRNDSSGSGPELVPGSTAHQAKRCPSRPRHAAHRADAAGGAAQPAPAPARPSAGPAAALQPIAPERHVLRVTVGAAFVADLEAVRQALSHKLPGAGLEEVLHECLRITLARVQRSPPRLRQEDLGEGASAGESIRPGRRSARGVDARWRPMRLRGEHGPAMYLPASTRAPPRRPFRQGRTADHGEPDPALPRPQPPRSRARLRTGAHRPQDRRPPPSPPPTSEATLPGLC